MTNPETKSQADADASQPPPSEAVCANALQGAILNQLVKNVEKIAVIEVTVKQNSQKLDNLDQRVDSLVQHVDGLDQRIDGLVQHVDGLDQRLTNIESLLGWLKWIAGGIGAIALSLIANFIYSFLH